MDQPPPAIDFDIMERQLAAAARRGSQPVATYRKGKLAIELAYDPLPREAFFSLLDVLGKYMRSFREFDARIGGCTFVADVFAEYQRNRDTLPPPLKVEFSFSSDGSGSVTFQKDALLMQEEINCVLDVWRQIVGDEPDADDPQTVVPYDSLAAQLEQTAERELASVAPALRNGSPPLVTLRKGRLEIEMQFQMLTREAFFPALEVMRKYMRSFTQLEATSLSVTITADVNPVYKRKRGKPIQFELTFDSRGTGRILVHKEALLIQEEINCVLDVWRKLAIRSTDRLRDPRAALADLGAVVFDPDPSYREERIAGYQQTKREVHETVVLPLVSHDVFVAIAQLTRRDAKPSVPRAVLFEGPPGTGKTTMARVLAAQANVPMVYVPVESIMSKWFGESERRLDAIFDHAGAFERSIVFLDEIDAFAGSRDGHMHEGTRRILSVLLRQMQGLVETSNVMVVGATNRAGDLDPALLNRFARTIRFPLPNARERQAILAAYARHLSPAELEQLAAATDGASGRTLEDGCGAAERTWAGRLIADHMPVTAPPLASYIEAFR